MLSIKVHFQDSKGTHLKTIEASEGDSILDLAHEYDIDLEGQRNQGRPPVRHTDSDAVCGSDTQELARGQWRVRHVTLYLNRISMICSRSRRTTKTICWIWRLV
jgi:hypothetical protein